MPPQLQIPFLYRIGLSLNSMDSMNDFDRKVGTEYPHQLLSCLLLLVPVSRWSRYVHAAGVLSLYKYCWYHSELLSPKI